VTAVEAACSAPDCDRELLAKGLCHLHYERMRRSGSLQRQRAVNAGQECSTAGCARSAHRGGMCRSCYGRWRRTGDPQQVARAVLDRTVSPPVPAPWTPEIDRYLIRLRSAGAGLEMLRVRSHHLKHLARQCPTGPWTVTADDLALYLSHDGWAPETRKSARASVKSFYGWALDTDRIERDPSRRLPAVRAPLGRPRPAPERVVSHALAAADPRGRLMVGLAAFAGLRRAEIAQVHTGDVTEDGELRIRGKGGKVRMVPLAAMLLDQLRALPEGYAFPSWGAGGHVSAGHVGEIVTRLLGPGWSTHTLRHRFATRAYSGDRDILAVQQLLGHASVRTTQTYTAVPDGALRAAVAAAALEEVPYGAGGGNRWARASSSS